MLTAEGVIVKRMKLYGFGKMCFSHFIDSLLVHSFYGKDIPLIVSEIISAVTG